MSIDVYICIISYIIYSLSPVLWPNDSVQSHCPMVLRIDAINAGDYNTCAILKQKKWQKSSEEHQSRTGTQMFGILDRILLLLLLLLLFGVAAVVSMVLGDVSQLGNLVGRARLKDIESICWNQLTQLHLAIFFCDTIIHHISRG